MSRFLLLVFSVFFLSGCSLFREQTVKKEVKKVAMHQFYQNVEPWASIKYACKSPKNGADKIATLKRGGSLPTALAMALKAYGKKVDPKIIGDYFVQKGYRTCNAGTKIVALAKAQLKFKYRVRYVLYYSAYKALTQGKIVIALMAGKNSKYAKKNTKSFFSNGAQYVVLSAFKAGKFRVYNTWKWSDKLHEGWIDASIFVTDAVKFFLIDVP